MNAPTSATLKRHYLSTKIKLQGQWGRPKIFKSLAVLIIYVFLEFKMRPSLARRSKDCFSYKN